MNSEALIAPRRDDLATDEQLASSIDGWCMLCSGCASQRNRPAEGPDRPATDNAAGDEALGR